MSALTAKISEVRKDKKSTAKAKAKAASKKSTNSASPAPPCCPSKGCPSKTVIKKADVLKKPAAAAAGEILKKPAAAAAGKKATAGKKDPLPKFPGLWGDAYPLRYMVSTVYLQKKPIGFRIKPCPGKAGRVDYKVRVHDKDTAAAWTKVCAKLREYSC